MVTATIAVSPITRSWTSGGARLYGASPIGTGRNCSGSGAYLSPLPLRLSLFPRPRRAFARQVRRTPIRGSESLSRHACIRALAYRDGRRGRNLTPLRRLIRLGGSRSRTMTTAPRHTPHRAAHRARPAGNARAPLPTTALGVGPQSASVIGCREPREHLVSSPSASTSSFSPLPPRTAARFMPLLSVRQPSASGIALDRYGVIDIDILFDRYRREQPSLLTKRIITIPIRILERLVNWRSPKRDVLTLSTRNCIPVRKSARTCERLSLALPTQQEACSLASHSFTRAGLAFLPAFQLFRQRAASSTSLFDCQIRPLDNPPD